jgi:hypothetical protein
MQTNASEELAAYIFRVQGTYKCNSLYRQFARKVIRSGKQEIEPQIMMMYRECKRTKQLL